MRLLAVYFYREVIVESAISYDFVVVGVHDQEDLKVFADKLAVHDLCSARVLAPAVGIRRRTTRSTWITNTSLAIGTISCPAFGAARRMSRARLVDDGGCNVACVVGAGRRADGTRVQGTGSGALERVGV